MALVSGRTSTLNPNAPIFIPAVVRQVEDFSPEWWDLVTTSAWFHDYWLSQRQGEDGFYGKDDDEFNGNDITDLLPDTIEDLGIDEELSTMEVQFEEFILSFETGESNNDTGESNKSTFSTMESVPETAGLVMEADALLKSMSLSKSLKERSPKTPQPVKYWEKTSKCVSPKCSPRRIQQPR